MTYLEGIQSDDEGYVKANDDIREFEDRDYDNINVEAEDVGPIPDGMREDLSKGGG
jgi:hypothetical protein